MLNYQYNLIDKRRRYYFQDYKAYTENLRVFDTLSQNQRCINTVDWDSSGTRLLYGGDDGCLKINQYMSYNNKSWTDEPIFEVNLPNTRNILSAKFMPVENEKIVSATKCGSIFVLDLNSVQSDVECFNKHPGAILNVYWLPNSTSEFMCLSNSRKLIMFDIRLGGRIPAYSKKFPCELSSADFHPLDLYKMAIGGSDGCIRVFDRRSLPPYLTSDDGVSKVIEVCRPLKFSGHAGALYNNNQVYGKPYVNSVRYEPILGRYLLANYMFDSIYLFDTRQTEDCPPELTSLPSERNEPACQSTPFNIHYNWDDTGPPEENNNPRSNLRCPPVIQGFLSNLQRWQRSIDGAMENQRSVDKLLKTTRRYKEIKIYHGSQNFRTMIKDTIFWGEQYILSGSECGHILVWHKDLDYPVAAVPTDAKVTNRVVPHPYLPILASCGLDYNVKIVASDMQEIMDSEERIVRLKQIVETNSSRTDRVRNSPSISVMDLLRIMRAQRIMSGINESNPRNLSSSS